MNGENFQIGQRVVIARPIENESPIGMNATIVCGPEKFLDVNGLRVMGYAIDWMVSQLSGLSPKNQSLTF